MYWIRGNEQDGIDARELVHHIRGESARDEQADLDRRRTSTTETAGFRSAYQAAAAPHKPAATRNAYHATEAQPSLIPRTPDPARTPATYGWSHGSTRNVSHTSMSCLKKSHGHQDTATAKNGPTKDWTSPTPRDT
jgi:hypothetical protein